MLTRHSTQQWNVSSNQQSQLHVVEVNGYRRQSDAVHSSALTFCRLNIRIGYRVAYVIMDSKKKKKPHTVKD